MATLLDVNVLVALAWPNHVHHAPAVRWFRAHHRRGWATAPVTEAGFVRVSSNRTAIPDARAPAEAMELLRRFTALAGHAFWTDGTSFAAGDRLDATRIVGHRQVTDAHLIALALAHRGRVATFDRGLRDVAPAGTDADSVVTLLA